jgi:hypothetical protein
MCEETTYLLEVTIRAFEDELHLFEERVCVFEVEFHLLEAVSNVLAWKFLSS